MKDRSLMPPPWLLFPHILYGSIGWRMGYGEDYMMQFREWFNSLDTAKKDKYIELFPGPFEWIGWYGKFNPDDRVQHNMRTVIDSQSNDYLFFWGHQPSKDGHITKSCLSQWWPCTFKVGHLSYNSTEQYMMACKARLFNDKKIEEKIMASNSPKKIKELGRRVKGFDEETWNEHKYNFVLRGNYCKFIQNPNLLTYLHSTNKKIIVEASPFDKVWGIGMKETDIGSGTPSNWNGENLLGFALMEVRDNIAVAYKNYDLLDIDYWQDRD